ncbi:hypothetical protein VNO77_44085 [Canavalia gladiata]|uniref:Fe-S metabolism associated domain-containing protein n=1 Tax=Canavalia gladiata TaxID=3824 RepID=A0AAN9JW10_CANGL
MASARSSVLTLSPSSFSKPNTNIKRSVTITNTNAYGKGLCSTTPKLIQSNSNSSVSDKLNGLASEFSSLSEPIDRVKRLLHYASLLPPFQNSDRVPANRVVGCATQVWLVAEMDDGGRMRFRADSDSEISKGFCWCLVWVLDGAKPEEVLTLTNLHLPTVNVGFNVKAQSRINTLHNVLFRMQKATQDLLFLPPPTSNQTKPF